jgi:hypothetical protein
MQELKVASFWREADIEPQQQSLQFKKRTALEIVAGNWCNSTDTW